MLIKKSYDRVKRVKNRIWKLKELDREKEAADTDDERYAYEEIATAVQTLLKDFCEISCSVRINSRMESCCSCAV